MSEKKKLSASERKKVEEQIAALQASLDDQAEADTAAEAREAEADVEQQRQQTADLFDRLGLTDLHRPLVCGFLKSRGLAGAISCKPLRQRQQAGLRGPI